ncbi:unnamed protein product [Closterium sp. NIES-54]
MSTLREYGVCDCPLLSREDRRGIRARAGEEDAEEEEEEEGLTGDEGEEGGVGEEAEGEDRGEGEAAVEGEQAEREAEEDAESDGEDWNLLHEYGLDTDCSEAMQLQMHISEYITMVGGHLASTHVFISELDSSASPHPPLNNLYILF